MEIERKFLVDHPPETLKDHTGVAIRQGYIASEEGRVVRLREKSGIGYLTVKSGSGLIRAEREITLREKDFEDLWLFTDGRRLEKVRYTLPLDGNLVAEVDVFAGDLNGLILVEVEFPDEGAARAFHTPVWFGEEVTEDPRYRNSRLVRSGIPVRGEG